MTKALLYTKYKGNNLLHLRYPFLSKKIQEERRVLNYFLSLHVTNSELSLRE